MDKVLKWLIWPIMAIPGIYLALVWNRLPESIAIHFNLQGEPDRYGNKNELLGMTLLCIGLSFILYFLLTTIARYDPKKTAVKNKTGLQRIAFAVCVFMAGISCVIIHSAVTANAHLSTRYIFVGTGLLFCIIGNYMHSIKPNYFAGIRLPWTLENEENWRKTHLLGGKLFFAGGLAISIICLFVPPLAGFITLITITIIITVIPGIYSYRLYKKHKSLAN